jgi:hypothetical protein
VEPVVVTPDMDSKKASVTLSSSSEKASGRAPKAAITSQARLVMMKAWRREKPDQPERVVSIKDTPTNSVIAAATAKTCQLGLATAASKIAGNTMANARIDSRIPMTKATGRKSIMDRLCLRRWPRYWSW